jgi:hypothetical protein
LPIGGDDVAHDFADLGAALRMLEDFCANIGEAQIARRALEQPHAELILELGHATADRLSSRLSGSALVIPTSGFGISRLGKRI